MIKSESILELQRKFGGSPADIKSMFEILCSRIRYYQTIEIKEGDELFNEVIDLIHWVSDFMPEKEYPFRVDTIKNQLWVSIGL